MRLWRLASGGGDTPVAWLSGERQMLYLGSHPSARVSRLVDASGGEGVAVLDATCFKPGNPFGSSSWGASALR
ncbi:hypothetical protein SD80_023025 [Scytonema tolypothrichoides VB-61278]|nr:hypothetical protein SD80_023025 [Scytonema tolypothrichoides VB-61278]